MIGEARFPSVHDVPGLGAVLPLAAAVVALVGMGALIPLLHQPVLVLVPIAAAAAVALVARRMDLGIYALVAATALNRYEFAVASWNAKIENVVLLVVLAALALGIAAGRERAQRLPLALVVGALLLVNVLASVVDSADFYKSIRIIVRMVLAVAMMWVVLNYVSDRAKLFNVLRALLIVGGVTSAFGIVALVVWHYSGRDFGIQSSPGTGAMSVKGTLWEANIFGSYVAGIAALSGGLLLSRIRTIDRRLLCVVFTVAVVALALSLTRGAWLGFAAGAISTVFFLRGARLSAVLLVVLVAVIGTAVVFQFDLGNTPQDVSARVATLSSMRSDSTTSSRLRNVDRAVSEWRQRPLLGWGTDGYHINHPDILSRLPCPELNALYDTGLVGLAAFALLVGAIFIRSAVASARHREEALATVLGALTIAGITQFIAFQVTDAFWLGFIWIYFGLMLGAVRLINEGAPA